MNINSGVHIWPQNACLISKLAKHLIKTHGHELNEVVVVLPTQRLITSLLAILAKEIGALCPPKMLTIEQFIEKYSSGQKIKKTKISDLVQEVILAALIRENHFRHLHLGQEHEIKQFFNDLAEHQLDQAAYDKLFEILHLDYYRDADYLQNLNERFLELKELHLRFQKVLSKFKLITETAGLAEHVHYLHEKFSEDSALPYKHLYFSCFTTLKAYIKPLISQLLQRESCSLWISESPDILSDLNPLRELLEHICERHEISIKTHKLEQTQKVVRRCQVHSSPTILGEIALALNLAKKYIEAGCPPSQIAILLTKESVYGKFLRTFISEIGLRSNLAISTSIPETSLGGWLMSLVDLLDHQSESKADLIKSFCLHSLTVKFLFDKVKSEIEELTIDELIAKMAKAISTVEHNNLELNLNHIANEIKVDCLSQALRLIPKIFQTLIDMTSQTYYGKQKKYKLKEWCKELDHVLEEFHAWDISTEADDGITQSSISALFELIDTLSESSDYVNVSLNGSDFWDLLKTKITSIETRSVGYPLNGIQILNLVESRYVPLEVVIVLGCVEGQFPKALPKDYLVDDWFKNKIGLPGWAYIEALEDTTFQLLKSRVPYIELCYPEEVNGEVTVRSRFIEKVLAEGQCIFYQDSGNSVEEILSHVIPSHSLSKLENSMNKIYDNYGFKLKDTHSFLTQISPTTLESLINCPYQFILKTMSIRPLDKQNDSILVGNILHKILEIFFTGQNKDRKFFPAFPSKIEKKSWKEWGMKRFEILTDFLLPQRREYAPLKYHLMKFSWPSFLNFLFLKLSEQDDKWFYFPTQRCLEWNLGKGHGVEVKLSQFLKDIPPIDSVFISGFLDRIDFTKNGYLLIDYKRKFIPTQNEINEGLSPQLTLYALALANENFIPQAAPWDQSCLMYWSVLDGKEKIVGIGSGARETFETKGLVNNRTPATDHLIMTLKKKWMDKIIDIKEKENKFQPESGKACTLCSFDGMCRKDDPAFKRIKLSEQMKNK